MPTTRGIPRRMPAASRRSIAELQDRDRVEETYLCLRKTLPSDRYGRRYLSLVLSDRTGQLEALLWDEAERRAERFAALDLVQVSGTAVLFQGRLELHLQDVRRVDPAGVRIEEFYQQPPRDPAQMWGELKALLASVQDAELARLIRSMIEDEHLVQQLWAAAAGRSVHHGYPGGLLEHTLSVAQLADRLCEHYRRAMPGLLNRDLCLVGAFLHDLGKLRELSTDPVCQYTDSGRLLGHLVLGLQLLDRKLEALPGFPSALADHLRHIVLSHHGRLEYGSPKRPKTAEALLVHRADELDGHLASLRDIFARSPGQGWTAYQSVHDRCFFRGWPSGTAQDDEQTEGGRDGGDDASTGGTPALLDPL